MNSDEEILAVAARAKRDHWRNLLNRYEDEGRVKVVTMVRVQIGDVWFDEPRNEYPSEGMVAQVGLALLSGVGDKNG